MTDFIDIADSNIVVAVLKIAAAIEDGYYITNTLAGYPVILPYLTQIRLFKGDKPEITKPIASDVQSVMIEGYDIFTWLLDVQEAVLQGFEFTSTQIAVDNYKGALATKKGKAKATPTPVTATAPESVVEAPEPVIVQESVEEAPKASRKSKTKGA